jgi:hypothetical protein
MYVRHCRLIGHDFAGFGGRRHGKAVLACYETLRDGVGRHEPRQALVGMCASTRGTTTCSRTASAAGVRPDCLAPFLTVTLDKR